MNFAIRLNVLLQKRGVASRRQADALIKAGRVRVNGVVVDQLGIKVARNARLTVDGIDYKKSPRKITYLFNKPPFVMSTRHDTQGRKTIFDCQSVKNLSSQVQHVGRLDYHSEGLILLTNDGDLAYALTHPKFDIEKTYKVLLSTIPTDQELDKLKFGVRLEDGFAKPTGVKRLRKENLGKTVGQWVEIVVTEGRNRLVRRMFEFFGLTVLRLIRTSIGEIKLPSRLGQGHVRPPSNKEKRYLKKVKLHMFPPKNTLRCGFPPTRE